MAPNIENTDISKTGENMSKKEISFFVVSKANCCKHFERQFENF